MPEIPNALRWASSMWRTPTCKNQASKDLVQSEQFLWTHWLDQGNSYGCISLTSPNSHITLFHLSACLSILAQSLVWDCPSCSLAAHTLQIHHRWSPGQSKDYGIWLQKGKWVYNVHSSQLGPRRAKLAVTLESSKTILSNEKQLTQPISNE